MYTAKVTCLGALGLRCNRFELYYRWLIYYKSLAFLQYANNDSMYLSNHLEEMSAWLFGVV